MRITDPQWRREHGWSVPPADICWLDCDGAGYLKFHDGKEIVLCMPHAQMLEAGSFNGSYQGAPTPPDSLATEWPWVPHERVVSVV